jgi:hypothetical protein
VNITGALVMMLRDFLARFPNKLDALREYQEYLKVFSVSRFKHQHFRLCGWMQMPGDLRGTTAQPNVFEWELKSGFYWSDLIH